MIDFTFSLSAHTYNVVSDRRIPSNVDLFRAVLRFCQ